jgi:endonuclease/exonuclease/phosphatase family metal-dependent hydrolase
LVWFDSISYYILISFCFISFHVYDFNPTEEKEDREKEKFYECLEEIYHKIQKYDLVIIMGDFNAKIGKEEYQKKVAGKQYMALVMKMETY